MHRGSVLWGCTTMVLIARLLPVIVPVVLVIAALVALAMAGGVSIRLPL